jgi:hypothetical protein
MRTGVPDEYVEAAKLLKFNHELCTKGKEVNVPNFNSVGQREYNGEMI